MNEILVHTYDEEPCDLGPDPHDDDICGHGWKAHHIYVEGAA